MERILFVIPQDAWFISHRLHLATSAHQQGIETAVLCHVNLDRPEDCQQIEAAGVQVIPWRISRGSLNPFKEFAAILDVANAVQQFKPDIIHVVAIKPILYLKLASIYFPRTKIVYALAGLGCIFSPDKILALILKPFVRIALRLTLNKTGTHLILQNPDDIRTIIRNKITMEENIHLIRGAGVDTVRFAPEPEPKGELLVILPARMLWDKGIAEFADSAATIKQHGVQARFILVGQPDKHNPASVPLKMLEAYNASGSVEWWGFCEDMPSLLVKAHVVCLPSYHEGLPKSLLEAASCARPIVTYDVPGCREIVEHNVNGLLVPFKNTEALIDAIEFLLKNKSVRQKMGQEGRLKVMRNFTQEHIAAQTMQVWEEVAGNQ